MKRGLFAMFAAFTLWVGAAAAQSPQPYAGLQTRPIKALSEQQIADLKSANYTRR
jgi:hypothetical protein